MKLIVAAARALIALGIFAAVGATVVDTASRVAINPFNFFGYFTIQSNLIIAVVYVLTVVTPGAQSRHWLVLARACATTYLTVVGLVYALLLAPLGAAGGVPLPWANVLLHVIVPVYAAADWLLVGDRHRVPFSSLWVTLVYPLLWCGVVLVRGATDGWVPYPFLDPATGYPSVLFYVAAIAVVIIVFGALVFWVSRWRGVVQHDMAPSR